MLLEEVELLTSDYPIAKELFNSMSYLIKQISEVAPYFLTH